MDVILLENIRRLGKLGDKVSVKPGYGRNYLVPQGKALPATEINLKTFEARRADLERYMTESLAAASARAEKLGALQVTIASKVGEEGKLFGSVGTRDIAHAVTQAGVPIEKKEIRLPQGAIRQIGQYEIPLQLHSDVTVNLKLQIIPEN